MHKLQSTFVLSITMGCITLLSDFGLQDASVASAKGILMQHVPDTAIIDISHLVEAYHLQQAAYLLQASYKYFPAGTCHVLLLDIYSEKKPSLIVCEYDGHYFLSPDNGLLPLAFGSDIEQVWKCYELQPENVFNDWLHAVGDIAKALQHQHPADMQLPSCTLRNAPQNCQPVITGNTVECQVIHIDRYENVVINITRKQFDEIGNNRNFRIVFMRDEELTEISTHYHDVKQGDKLCRFNAAGYLEIAINRGHAASLFGLRLRRDQHLMYSSIKIFFE